MLRSILATSMVVLFCAAAASAQIKVTSAGQCAKGDPENTIPIPDRPNHAFDIAQSKCTYTKPTEIGGVKASGGTAWQSGEVIGARVRYHGYYEETLANGDKLLYHYEGKGAVKDGVLQSSDETWSILRATGASKGLKGKGTCKVKGNADGSSAFECEGEFQPSPAPTKKSK